MTEEGKSILVIEDDPAMARLLARVLTRHGYEAFGAGGCEEALQIMASRKISMVLLDLIMPLMDRWETCRRIRLSSDVPLLVITGSEIDEETKAQALKHGVYDLLTKPVRNGELIKKVAGASNLR